MPDVQNLPRLAIVSTIADAGRVIHSFAEYHKRLGVGHCYLFVDKPEQVPHYEAQNLPQTTLVCHDEVLRQSWQNAPSWSAFGHQTESHVMAKQCLNAEVAAKMALRDGFDWLLHIDADELLYLPGPYLTAPAWLSQISPAVDTLALHNHEAIPETLFVDDYFREVSLFKRSTAMLTGKQQRLAKKAFGDDYFKFYRNGKGLVRLREGIQANGVHRFIGQNEYHRTDAGILHYSCCGANHHAAKYRTLGQFPDHWWGDQNGTLRFDTDLRARDARSSEEALQRLYVQDFLGQAAGQRERLEAEGVLFRFDAKQIIG